MSDRLNVLLIRLLTRLLFRYGHVEEEWFDATESGATGRLLPGLRLTGTWSVGMDLTAVEVTLGPPQLQLLLTVAAGADRNLMARGVQLVAGRRSLP